jgi:hypothetical protein
LGNHRVTFHSVSYRSTWKRASANNFPKKFQTKRTS